MHHQLTYLIAQQRIDELIDAAERRRVVQAHGPGHDRRGRLQRRASRAQPHEQRDQIGGLAGNKEG